MKSALVGFVARPIEVDGTTPSREQDGRWCLTMRSGRAYIDAVPAGWQSGYAEDCKSSYSGSIPLPAFKT